MTNKDFLSTIASIHNRLIDVNVRGEDVMRMADILNICRTTASKLQNEIRNEESETKAGGLQLGE